MHTSFWGNENCQLACKQIQLTHSSLLCKLSFGCTFLDLCQFPCMIGVCWHKPCFGCCLPQVIQFSTHKYADISAPTQHLSCSPWCNLSTSGFTLEKLQSPPLSDASLGIIVRGTATVRIGTMVKSLCCQCPNLYPCFRGEVGVANLLVVLSFNHWSKSFWVADAG